MTLVDYSVAALREVVWSGRSPTSVGPRADAVDASVARGGSALPRVRRMRRRDPRGARRRARGRADDESVSSVSGRAEPGQPTVDLVSVEGGGLRAIGPVLHGASPLPATHTGYVAPSTRSSTCSRWMLWSQQSPKSYR